MINRYRLKPIAIYLLIATVVSLVLFWRYPNNVLYANFYAEDGSVFLQSVLNKGWVGAALTPFNGYFVVGLYVLEAFGWVANSLFGHAGILSLPASFAAVAIVFMGSVIALPYLLFSTTLGKFKMLAVVTCSMLLPLPLGLHIVLGTIGNQKWTFMYLATLLVAYRLLNHNRLSAARLISIDAILLLCAYTNSTTYALVPLLYLPYLSDYWKKREQSKLFTWLRLQIKTRELVSLLVLTLLLLPQLVYVGLQGIPVLPGYLDTPYELSKSIEVFINRTYLFGVTHYFNGYLNDALSVVGFIVLIGAWRWMHSRERIIFLISLYAAGVASALFVFNRPGVTAFFNGYHYSGSGPDQFFFAQTLIMYLPVVLAICAYACLFKSRWLRISLAGLAVAFIVVSGLLSNAKFGAHWRNASIYENSADTFVDQAIGACDSSDGRAVKLALYPYIDGRFSLTIPRPDVCTDKLSGYQTSVTHLNLVPDNNNYVTLPTTKVTQTFKATGSNLNGVRIFLSNFNQPERQGEFTLGLYDAACRHRLRTAHIPEMLLDNSMYNARFSPISDSKGKTYCIQILGPSRPPYHPIAVQQSAPNIYPNGQLSLNGNPQMTDLVFEPLYTQTR